MQIKLQTIQVIIEIVTFIIAYMTTITLAGSFRAWVAYLCGDSTAKNFGYTSLNPLVHIDLMGLIFLLWFYFRWGLFFTWGRPVIIDPSNIRGYLRIPKIIIAFFSDTFAYFAISIVMLTLLVTLFDINLVSTAGFAFIERVSHARLMAHSPEASSIVITIAFIIISTLYLSLFLAFLSIVSNIVTLGLNLFARATRREDLLLNSYWVVFISLMILLILVGPLHILSFQVIVYAGRLIAQIFHLT